MLEALQNGKPFDVDDRGYLLVAREPPKTHATWRVFGAERLPEAGRMRRRCIQRLPSMAASSISETTRSFFTPIKQRFIFFLEHPKIRPHRASCQISRRMG